MVVRYMAGVKPDMRVKFGSRYLYIEAVIIPKEKRELLHLYYREAAD
jgi:head-tail adaptor